MVPHALPTTCFIQYTFFDTFCPLFSIRCVRVRGGGRSQ